MTVVQILNITYICANDFSIFYAVAKDFLKIAEDTAAAATSDVPYAKERVAMMLTILKRFMVQAGASGKYLPYYNTSNMNFNH